MADDIKSIYLGANLFFRPKGRRIGLYFRKPDMTIIRISNRILFGMKLGTTMTKLDYLSTIDLRYGAYAIASEIANSGKEKPPNALVYGVLRTTHKKIFSQIDKGIVEIMRAVGSHNAIKMLWAYNFCPNEMTEMWEKSPPATLAIVKHWFKVRELRRSLRRAVTGKRMKWVERDALALSGLPMKRLKKLTSKTFNLFDLAPYSAAIVENDPKMLDSTVNMWKTISSRAIFNSGSFDGEITDEHRVGLFRFALQNNIKSIFNVRRLRFMSPAELASGISLREYTLLCDKLKSLGVHHD